MAVDRKSDHVGNHGGAYTDMQGNRRQFTYIDHDPKTKISGHTGESIDDIHKQLAKYRLDTVAEILEFPASLCPVEFVDFTQRGEGHSIITWNETMLKDGGITTNRLRDLNTVLSNRFNTRVV